MRDGSNGVLRKLDDATGEYVFTRLGMQCYKTQRRNYVASVPALVEGTRKNGSTYNYKTHVSIEKLGLRPKELPLNLRSPERYRRVKRMIEKELSPSSVLYGFSEERYTLDPGGSWLIHEDTVRVDRFEDGHADVVLDRRMGARPLAPATLRFAEHVCEEEFREFNDKLCGPRHFADVLKHPLDDILEQLRSAERSFYGTDTIESDGCWRSVAHEAKAQQSCSTRK